MNMTASLTFRGTLIWQDGLKLQKNNTAVKGHFKDLVPALLLVFKGPLDISSGLLQDLPL